jgi:hypothetical protein
MVEQSNCKTCELYNVKPRVCNRDGNCQGIFDDYWEQAIR